MSDPKQIRPTYVDLPDDLKRRVKSAASLRGLQFKSAVIEALESWLQSDSSLTSEDMDRERLPGAGVSQKSAGVESTSSGSSHGSTSPVSSEQLKQILLDFRAEIVKELARTGRPRAAEHRKGRKKAG